MTVRELIEKLGEFDGALNVILVSDFEREPLEDMYICIEEPGELTLSPWPFSKAAKERMVSPEWLTMGMNGVEVAE